MRRATIRIKIVGMTLSAGLAFGALPGGWAADTQGLVKGNTTFALDLYKQLKATPGNLFFSPYSISMCLGMAYAGARGDTEKQMADVLHFPKDARVHAAFRELQEVLSEAGREKGIELSIANGLWAQKEYPFLPEFLNVARNDYAANIQQVDFKTEAEAARNEINRWVEDKTKGKIQNLLPSGSLDALTRLVLANAVYFKGTWTKRFEKEQTATQPFHVSAATQVSVPLMHHFDEVKYTENAELQAVELPYSKGELAMVILLPRQVEGCGKLEGPLSPEVLARTLGALNRQRVEIFLPRFKLESRFQLKPPLAEMGMVNAFTPKADFSGIDGSRGLNISEVFHKAWGLVNEEGTEAAAATGTVMTLSAARPSRPPVVFRADHPFVFFIRDTRSGSILFLGRLSDPSR